ncbi:MAG: hypothetical protein ACI4QT_04960, partial [Kiritimatiellia bacterium]
MTENTDNVTIGKLDGKGALWTIAGTAIASVANQFLNGIHGNGGFCGGNGVQQAANTAVAYELAKKDSEIALLKAENDTDKKLVEVFTELRRIDKSQDAALSALNTRVTAVETSAPLREQIVLGQVQSVANSATCGINNLQTQIACIQQTLSGITKCVVPITAVCPQPMKEYNSWTAPTTT